MDLRLNYADETMPGGITATFTAMTGGTATRIPRPLSPQCRMSNTTLSASYTDAGYAGRPQGGTDESLGTHAPD